MEGRTKRLVALRGPCRLLQRYAGQWHMMQDRPKRKQKMANQMPLEPPAARPASPAPPRPPRRPPNGSFTIGRRRQTGTGWATPRPLAHPPPSVPGLPFTLRGSRQWGLGMTVDTAGAGGPLCRWCPPALSPTPHSPKTAMCPEMPCPTHGRRSRAGATAVIGRWNADGKAVSGGCKPGGGALRRTEAVGRA